MIRKPFSPGCRQVLASIYLSVLCITLQPADSTAQTMPESSTVKEETVHTVNIGDKTVVLEGSVVHQGQSAPDFKVVDEHFEAVHLRDFAGSPILLSVVPSIDTGVCSLQTKRFNDAVLDLPGNVKILTISTDLPFAQKRFCTAEKVDNLQVLSDAVWRDFGLKYGLLIKDMGLLSRAVYVIDSHGMVRYKQLVPQLSQQPDYDKALTKLKQLVEPVNTQFTDTQGAAQGKGATTTAEP